MKKHHLPNGKFKNLEGSHLGKLKILDMVFFLLRRLTSRKKVSLPPHHVIPENEALSLLKTHENMNSITWLGHSSFLIRLQGKTILTDPFLTERAGVWKLGPKRFASSGISIEHLPDIDIILVSHNHYDHLDIKTIKQLKNRFHTKVVIPLKLANYFLKEGYLEITELDWYETASFDGIDITALPAIHYSRRGVFDKNRSLWVSFAISNHQHRVYFSGDTAYGNLFKSIGQAYGPFDIAIMGIGACEPRKVMGFFHLSPEEAVQAGIDLKAKKLIGMHWGTIVLSEEPPFDPPIRFKQAAKTLGMVEEYAEIMRIGETKALKI